MTTETKDPLREWPTGRPASNRIESETVLLPYIVAERVVDLSLSNHASPTGMKWLQDRKDEFVARLVEKAEIVYEANPNFQKKMKAENNREYLYLFMNHWLNAMMCGVDNP